MSKKDKTQPVEPLQESKPEIPEAELVGIEPQKDPDISNAFEQLQKELAEAQSQAAEYKDGWQRALADFQNYKRRVDADSRDTYQNAVGDIIRRYLPVNDDLERALEARPTGLAWADGIELIHRKLQSILEAEGLKRIQAEGQMFDPNFQEAVSQEPSEDHECGEVIAVVQNGYMLGDKVIRPAKVRVAK